VTHPLLLPPNTVPTRFVNRSLSEIENPHIVKTITTYLGLNFNNYATRGMAPAFLGRSGTWKSFGAGFIADRLYTQARVPVEYVKCSSQLPELERSRYEAATNRFLKRLKHVPFLVMDDFTQIRIGSWMADMLLEIAEDRYTAVLPTLWTGNVIITPTDQSALIEGYGASFARRLVEGARGLLVVIE
jgi:DNA replication protein DnaC